MKTTRTNAWPRLWTAAILYSLSSIVSCLATEYYVDASEGSDDNDGLGPQSAWCTLARVNRSDLAPGDKILLKRNGTWPELLTIPSSGVPGIPIVIEPYGEGNPPTIKGSDVVRSWTAYSDNVWVTQLGEPPGPVFMDHTRGYQESSVSQLDAPNEWCWADGVLYIYARMDPVLAYQNPGVQAGTRAHCLEAYEKSYLTVRGLRLMHSQASAVYLSKVSSWSVEDCVIEETGQGNTWRDAALLVGGSNDVQLVSNSIDTVYGDGIYVWDSEDVEIRGNQIAECYGAISDNIHVEQTTDYRVLFNSLSQKNSNSPKGNCISQLGRNGRIAYNTATYGNSGISVEDSNTCVEFNIVHDHATAGIYVAGDSTSVVDGVTFRNNVVYSESIGMGVFSNAGYVRTNIRFFNNTIYGTSSCGVMLYRVSGEFKNNIVWVPATGSRVYSLSSTVSGEAWSSDYNLLGPEKEGFVTVLGNTYAALSAYQASETQDLHSLSAAPSFVSDHDLHVKSDSPSIDAGTAVDVLEDIDGNHIPYGQGVDIGAYEYTGSGPYTIALTTANGSIVEIPDKASYGDGETVSLTATPSLGYRFVAWSDGLSGSENPAILVMDANKSVTATFAVNTYTLDAGATHGQVSKSPDGGVYEHGTAVVLQAIADVGYSFAGWSGDLSGGSSPITITMDGDKSVTATFEINMCTLDVSAVNGSVVCVPDEPSYSYGTVVTLQAVPNTGYNFGGWSGDASGNSSATAITMNGDKSITANFVSVDLDTTPPTLAASSPEPDAVQVPLNSLISLHVSDGGDGVDPASVSIQIDGDLVYAGDVTRYDAQRGACRRLGTGADYTFVYQSDDGFDYGRQVAVVVNARDLAGNVMAEKTYAFATEMYSFGRNHRVCPIYEGLDKDRPATTLDSHSNIWIAWQGGTPGARQVYVSEYYPDSGTYGGTVELSQGEADNCNPVIACQSDGTLLVVWQGNARGVWDIYASTSVDGKTWSVPRRIIDSSDNQMNPVIAAGTEASSAVALVWQDDRAGNQDIYVAQSTDGFLTADIYQVTTSSLDQTGPAIAVDSRQTVFLVWTDTRNGSADIYGAGSAMGPWTNVALVTGEGNQSHPAVAVEPEASVLHLVWVDDSLGNLDICYGSTATLSAGSLARANIIDDSGNADQRAPVIEIAVGSDGSNRVFACWEDDRNVADSGDTDVYFADLSPGSTRTNVLVGDEGTNSGQSLPALGVGLSGQPYVAWSDHRSTYADIYCAAATFADPVPLAFEEVSAASGAVVGTEPASVTGLGDVSVAISAGACPFDVAVSISQIRNPPALGSACLGGYDLGPSGLQFVPSVTVTIPYEVEDSAGVGAYWYDARTGTLSQQGITDIRDIAVTPTLHTLQFKTSHFTPFYLVAATEPGDGLDSAGGGCSMSPHADMDIGSYFVPYVALFGVMVALRRRDACRRRQAASNCLSNRKECR